MNELLWHQVRAAAARFPERPAVEGPDSTLSYAELERESSRVAALLAGWGVRRGDRVGLFLPKSARAVAVLIGVLRAGGVYVPIDPKAPPRRAAYILQNAAARVLVTERAHLAGLGEHLAGLPSLDRVLLADGAGAPASTGGPDVSPWAAVEESEPRAPEIPASESDPAYILYTSGSTGQPKGVVISHRNALAFVDWAAREFDLRPEDRLSNHAPFHFDLSVFDLYAAFRVGGCVVLVPDRVAPFPGVLARWIQEKRISVWYSVPSALIRLLSHGGLADHRFLDLRIVLYAGEVFPIDQLRKVMACFPSADFFNLYGPTETNVCTFHALSRPLPPEVMEIPIGRACSGDEAFALTPDGRLAGAGETGELLVRGPTVALGYWRDPQKTAASLVQNPLHADFVDPVYRTGDLVRVLPNGAFGFIGRRDHMVKTRGHRVELGEVEAVLAQHAQVREAIVVPIPDPGIGTRLIAVVVAEEGVAPTPGDLRGHCAGLLPTYAIPEHFELTAELPRTGTGKTDRLRLAAEFHPHPRKEDHVAEAAAPAVR